MNRLHLESMKKPNEYAQAGVTMALLGLWLSLMAWLGPLRGSAVMCLAAAALCLWRWRQEES